MISVATICLHKYVFAYPIGIVAEENCTLSDDIEIEYILMLIVLLYFLIFTNVIRSVRTSRIHCSVSCHASKHHNFHDHRYCHKCHKVVCFGNVKDHIGNDLFVASNSLNTLVFLLEISSTTALMEVQISNDFAAFTETVLTDISKNIIHFKKYNTVFEILKMYTPYPEICKVFKTIKIYFKTCCAYTLYHIKNLTNMKKIARRLKPLLYTSKLENSPTFQPRCGTNYKSGILKDFEKSGFINISKKMNKLPFTVIFKELTKNIWWHNDLLWLLVERYFFVLRTFFSVHSNSFEMLANALVSTTASNKVNKASRVLFSSVKVTCLKGTAHNCILKSNVNGNHLFSEITDGLKESTRHNILYTVIDLIRCTDTTHNTTAALLFSAAVLGYSKTVTSVWIPKKPSIYIYNCFLQNFVAEIRLVQGSKCSQLTLANYRNNDKILLLNIITGLDIIHQLLADVECDSFRQFDITSVTEQASQQLFSSQGDHYKPYRFFKTKKHIESIQQDIEKFNATAVAATNGRDQTLEKQSEGYSVPRLASPILFVHEGEKFRFEVILLQAPEYCQRLFNSALKFQGKNNTEFRLVINKENVEENNCEIQAVFISSQHRKYSILEMLSGCNKSLFKEIKSSTAPASLGSKWCTASNTRVLLHYTALQITWFNGIAYNYLVNPTVNPNHLFAEMVDGLKESVRHKMPCVVIDFRRCTSLTYKITASLLFDATLFGHLRSENILITEISHLSLDTNVFYFSNLYNCLSPSFATESIPEQWRKYSQLIIANTNNENIPVSHIVTGLVLFYHQLVDITYDLFRPFGKGITPATEPVKKESFTNSVTNHQAFTSQGDHCVTDGVPKVNDYTEANQQSLQQYNAAAISETRDQPTQQQSGSHHMPVSSTNQLTKDNLQRDGNSSKHGEGIAKAYVQSEQDVVEKDGKLSMASGIDQATPISSIPSEHKLMIGNVNNKPVNHNPSGAHIVKELPKQTELLPTLGPQLDALYNTNFEHEVQSSREEVRQKAKARTTFYQHDFEHHAYNPNKMGEMNFPKNPPLNDKLPVKVPEVKAEIGKAANDYKPKPLPKRSQIVCGSKQYPLVSNLISHPHMDHYFVKERTEIRPSHYLAKLVLRHQYLNR